MRSEGLAMLLSIASDLGAWPDSEIVIAANEDANGRLAELAETVTWYPCRDVPSLVAEFSANEKRFDAAFCIAPEGDDCLQTTVNLIRQISNRVICASDDVIQLGSDKLAFHNWCVEKGFPTIPVLPLCSPESWLMKSGDLLIAKPRFGAGCEGVQRYRWNANTLAKVQSISARDVIWQPFVTGQFYSVGVMGRGLGTDPIVLPVASQNLNWDDDHPLYRGGQVPAVLEAEQRRQLAELIDKVISELQINDGYVGFDLIYTDDEKRAQWQLVELNPRLCTSYLGYRRLFQQNLARSWWDADLKLSELTTENPVKFGVNVF